MDDRPHVEHENTEDNAEVELAAEDATAGDDESAAVEDSVLDDMPEDGEPADDQTSDGQTSDRQPSDRQASDAAQLREKQRLRIVDYLEHSLVRIDPVEANLGAVIANLLSLQL